MKPLKLFLLLILVIGVIFRFYNLNWGAPFYFHPDERNIATAINQLHFPNQLNPHFFAYGSVPIYITYFTGVRINMILQFGTGFRGDIATVPFDMAILIGRFYSALLSVAILFFLYKCGTILKNQLCGFITVVCGIFSVGFIQFAHFSTFEMWLSCFSLILFWLLLLYLKTSKNVFLILASLVIGLLLSIKISAAVLYFPYLLVLVMQNNQKFSVNNVLKKLALFIGGICLSLFFYLITSPYNFFDNASFQSSIRYESDVATGILPVFYTQEFFNTIPGLFQFLHVYPFLLNPILTVLFIPAVLYVIYVVIKQKNKSYLLLTTFYLLLFISQAILFVKWTRYMIPTLPFIYLILAIATTTLIQFLKKKYHVVHSTYYVVSFLFVISFLFSVSYVITAFVEKDSRITAAKWAKEKMPANAQIVSEVYDLGILPFNTNFSSINLYNFYDVANPQQYSEAKEMLGSNNYVILPSQRILKSRITNREKFPEGNKIYEKLLSGRAYKKIYETPCDIFCKVTYLGSPIFAYEQTANVFDRPTIIIFENTEYE